MPNWTWTWIQYLPWIVAGAVLLIYLSIKFFKVKLRSERHTYPSCKHGTSKRELCIHCRNEAQQFFDEADVSEIPGTVTFVDSNGALKSIRSAHIPLALCDCGHYAHDHSDEGCSVCLYHANESPDETGEWCTGYTPAGKPQELPADLSLWRCESCGDMVQGRANHCRCGTNPDEKAAKIKAAYDAALKRTQDLINSNKLLRTCVTCGTMFYEGGRCVCYPH